MNLRILFLAAAGALLSGCTLGFEATFEDLSLVREEPPEIVAQYSLPGREAPSNPLTGMLRLDFAAGTDLFELMEDEGYNIWFKVETCRSKVEVVKWPNIYKIGTVPLETRGKIHHYSVFLNTTWRGHYYDLKRQPESICVVVRAGKMVALFNYRSNTFVVDRDQVIRAFEAEQ